MSYYRTWWGSIWQGTPPPVVSHSAVSASASPWIQRAYLSRLESGWEEAPCPPLLPLPPIPDDPPPVPADCRFPDKSFSTAARFPVRAASRSSCSFPIVDPPEKNIYSEEARGRGEKRGGGRIDCGSEIPLRSPLFFLLLSRLQVIPQYSCRCWCGEETKAPSAAGFVRPDPRCRWRSRREGEKFRSAARYHHRANFLWPVPRASSVTSSKLPFLFCVPNPKPFRHTHTHEP